MISVSEVVSHCFCPRFTYYSTILGLEEFQEKRGTVKSGREMHKKYQKTNISYMPPEFKDYQKIIEMKLYSKKHEFVGIVDQAYFGNGEIILVERKFTDTDVIWPTVKIQAGLLSILLEENYGIPVNDCVLVYSKSKRVIKNLPVTDLLKNDALDMLEKTRQVIDTCLIPDAEAGPKCNHCCYRNVCEIGSYYGR